ncbi:hypothetical protein BDM02DRAFT_3192519 [Thelephora ganbajun]|uniref:Uncharacterized protein n=1 Tax=Thelephora ganbajun TaxID=370292 RepID=A0ACB6YZJ3_THEGA|nr:hypothetical protein BDM02DRAFT_3192519 [Thelephora ganbajun]
MSWFKKFKKPRQPPQPLGIPTHIAVGSPSLSTNLDLGISPEAVNNGRVSRDASRDRSGGRRPHASGASTPIHGREDGVTRGYILLQLMGPMSMILIVLREREDERQVPSSAPNEQPSHDAPDLSSAERQSEVQNRVECEDRETVTEQPPEAPPEHISEDDHIGRDAHDTVQSRGSEVVERDYRGTTPGAPATRVNIPKEPAGGFGSLKAKTTVVGNKIEDLLSRIETLEARFAIPPGNVVEQRRRSELIREFGRIEGQLRSLPDNPELRRLDEHVQDDEEVYRLLEDIRETIFDYQMAQQTAIYKQASMLISPAEASVLKDSRCAQGAKYRHGDRRGCLKGTRRAVLDQIEHWTRDFGKPPVYWLNGLAGTGKSTIAQTIAERIFADGQLGASFFCSRDFEDRRNLHFIFPTLAVQLARRYTEFRSIFVPLVQSDPGIVDESLYNQMKKLIVEPLEESGISTVIVIDALDECKDVEPASAILSVLGQFVSEIPKATNVFVLHEVESSQVGNDIRLFFKQGFLELTRRRGELDEWPTKEQLDLLCERAAGLFVYAVATVKFIDHRKNNPKKQLDRLLLLPKGTVYEGMTKFKTNTMLDSLYASILQEAFGDDYPEDDSKVRSVLGAVILAANPLSPSTIATLLGIDREGVFLRLSSIHSLLILQENAKSPVRSFHKSFPDFIVDPVRRHVELLTGCLNLMNQTLEKNMCKLSDAVTNSEVPDLRERTERYISPALQYACKSWHKHFVDEHTVRTPEITFALHWLLENKFVFWLEVLSVLGAAREAVDALDLAAKWSKAPPTIELVNDCFRFVTGFFQVIDESAPHIYHSALAVSPRTSIVRELYERHANPMARIVHGLPDSWDPVTVTMEYSCSAAAWSPCGRFIAISDGGSRAEIRDAVTFKRLTILEFPEGHTQKLVFSPDARLLTSHSVNPTKFISWDLQTGILVSAISLGRWDYRTKCFSITYSACGTMFGALIGHTHTHRVEWRAVENIWTHGECLRFAVEKPRFITTWEVGFASRSAPTEIGSLPLPGNFPHGPHVHLFHPTLSRLAFTRSGKIFVWDAQHFKFLLNKYANDPYGISFSTDGHLFMYGIHPYGTGASEIYFWKESPTGHILYRKLDCEIEISKQLISPNGESIFVCDNSAIQLWRTVDPTASFSRNPTDEGFIVEFSPDETLAAVALVEGDTITVLDLKSGNSLFTIDTGMEVYGQRVTGSAVAAAGREKVVAWNLPAQNLVPNTKANINDNIWTATPLTVYPEIRSLRFVSISPDLHSIAILGCNSFSSYPPSLHLHDVPTGRCLGSVYMHENSYGRPWFTSDGREVWYVTDHGKTNGLTIVEDSESGVIKLEQLGPTRQPPNTPPWLSSRGHQVTDDGWILGVSGKRLLWLPPHWRSLGTTDRTWSGRFLALLHYTLPEAVILELEE